MPKTPRKKRGPERVKRHHNSEGRLEKKETVSRKEPCGLRRNLGGQAGRREAGREKSEERAAGECGPYTMRNGRTPAQRVRGETLDVGLLSPAAPTFQPLDPAPHTREQRQHSRTSLLAACLPPAQSRHHRACLCVCEIHMNCVNKMSSTHQKSVHRKRSGTLTHTFRQTAHTREGQPTRPQRTLKYPHADPWKRSEELDL